MSWLPRGRMLIVSPVGGALATLTYVLLPSADARSVFTVVVGLIAAGFVVRGSLRARLVNGGAWLIFTAGQVLWLAGDSFYAADQLTAGLHRYPSWPDVCYLSAYPLLIVAVYRLGQQWRPRDSARLLDTAMIAAGLALVYWTAVADNVVSDSRLTVLSRLFTVAYPVMAVVLFAVVVPLLLRRDHRTPSIWLLIVGATMTMACTAGYSLLPAANPLLTNIIFGGYLFTYVCFAAAAMHPSARTLDTPSREVGFARGRLLMLSAASVLPTGVLIWEGIRNRAQVGWPAVSIGSITVSLLVMARLAGFVRQTRRQASQLHDLAMQDDLTGLPNRRSFELSLAHAIRHGTPHVMLLDLNGFKEINDHFGHAVGDRLLVAVAERLSGALRRRDVVARMGGDEFAVLVQDAPVHLIDSVAERLDEALRAPVEVDEHHLLISTSIGTVNGEGIPEPFEILRRADLAMYDAKRQRSKRHRWYNHELDELTQWRTQIAGELRAALDTDQLHVVYQPIVSLPEGRTVSVEALLRWHHPDRGPISPTDFIPIAEETGIIVELGETVLREACAQAVVWRDSLGETAPQRISVNVSARQLAEAGFPQTVATILASTGWAAHKLVIEITETAVFGGTQTMQAVNELHQLGIRIALDDFGTGHSSLGLLQSVPVDVLKVDKSFVENITMAGRHVVIAAALIDISHGLGLTAVAEGVETPEQATKLYDLGYRLAQGYYFGRPMRDPDFSTVPINGVSSGVDQ